MYENISWGLFIKLQVDCKFLNIKAKFLHFECD